MPPTPNQNRIDQLLQFILLTAGQEDEYTDRWLSPIHLIKYVYLADLVYARYNEGQIYTGLNWQFYHYGPWERTCFQRIDPALESIQAEKRVIESKYYDDDRDRWYASDDNLHQKIQEALPLIILGDLSKAIHRFGSDTKNLLHYVYITRPMLTAAPGELLDFNKELEAAKEATVQEDEPTCQLTARQLKKRNQLIREIKSKYRNKLDELKKRRSSPQPFPEYTPPRYDDVYFQGLEDLDRIAGKKIQPGEYKAVFSDDVWKSKARFDPDLS